jgi:hypothetical protein
MAMICSYEKSKKQMYIHKIILCFLCLEQINILFTYVHIFEWMYEFILNVSFSILENKVEEYITNF